MSANAGAGGTARNVDITDRELLHGIADLGGQTTSKDLADRFGLRTDGVARRLGWMRRFGWVLRTDPEQLNLISRHGAIWTLSPIGEELMNGKLPRSVETAIDKADPGAYLSIMRQLTRRAYVESRDEVANAVRREYLHGVAKRTQ